MIGSGSIGVEIDGFVAETRVLVKGRVGSRGEIPGAVRLGRDRAACLRPLAVPPFSGVSAAAPPWLRTDQEGGREREAGEWKTGFRTILGRQNPTRWTYEMTCLVR